MNKEAIEYTITFKGQEAADAARIIERNMENKVFVHKLLICALSLEKVYTLKK